MRSILLAAGLVLAATTAQAQYIGQYSTNPYATDRVNPYQSGGSLYDSDNQFRGNVNGNRYDPDSTSNPYGQYGSRYSPDSINNPYGQYGSRYSNESPNNRYGQGLKVCGTYGCD